MPARSAAGFSLARHRRSPAPARGVSALRPSPHYLPCGRRLTLNRRQRLHSRLNAHLHDSRHATDVNDAISVAFHLQVALLLLRRERTVVLPFLHSRRQIATTCHGINASERAVVRARLVSETDDLLRCRLSAELLRERRILVRRGTPPDVDGVLGVAQDVFGLKVMTTCLVELALPLQLFRLH